MAQEARRYTVCIYDKGMEPIKKGRGEGDDLHSAIEAAKEDLASAAQSAEE